MERCIFCQSVVESATGRCQRCGRSQPVSAATTQQGIHCPRCQEVLPPQARFCGHCGQVLPPLTREIPGREANLPISAPALPASIPRIFLAAARLDEEIALRVHADLVDQGITVVTGEIDVQAERAAIREAHALVLIASPHARRSRAVRTALTLAQIYQHPIFPLWLAGEAWNEALPAEAGNLSLYDGRGGRYQAGLGALLLALRAVVQPVAPGAVILPTGPAPGFALRNPYKGLRPFTAQDRGDFFGRDRLIGDLERTLVGTLAATPGEQQARLLALVGPSGSGKSSVILAGLLPRLRAGALPGSERWVYLEPLVPGTHPLETLALALAQRLPERSLKAIREDLEDDSTRGLHLLASHLAPEPGARVVVVIDQFEELFTQMADEVERQRFVDLLLTAITEPRGPCCLLLTLRADFYDRLTHYPPLARLIKAHHHLILPMDLDELRRVIEQPAALPDVQLTFEGMLVGDLLFEVQGQTGALPLLQFVLYQLFQRRRGNQLTLAAYRELGGVKGALARHAEAVYAALPSEEHRMLARALFLRLIDPGATEQDTTRRRAALTELALPDPQQTRRMQAVADAFVAARLLITNEIAGTTTIEVSHEALIREWMRLGEWLRAAREDIPLQQTISRDVAEWERHGRPRDRLYRGSQLKEARAWASRSQPSGMEVDFLHAGARARTQFRVSVFAVALLIVLLTGGTAGILYRLSITPADPTLVKTNEDTGQVGSLRYDLENAPERSTIRFASSVQGTIRFTGAGPQISRDLTLVGPTDRQISISSEVSYALTIAEDVTVTIFNLTFHSSVSNAGTLTLTNSTISNSTAPTGNGGGIYNTGRLTLRGSSVLGNTAASTLISAGIGGGVYNVGTLTLIQSVVSRNAATHYGGGIYNGGMLTLTASTVSENGTSGTQGRESGGGIYNDDGGKAMLTNSTIEDNTADGIGAGIFNQFRGQVMITASTIANNSAKGGAVGIYTDGMLTLIRSTVMGNHVETPGNFGGGIVNDLDGTLLLIESTVAQNSTHGDGSGVVNLDGSATLIDSTISENQAYGFGGGILSFSQAGDTSHTRLIFCTVYDNTADVGGGIANEPLFSGVVPQPIKVSNSLVAGNLTTSGLAVDGPVITGGYNLFQGLVEASILDPDHQHGTDQELAVGADPGVDQMLSSNPGSDGKPAPTQTHALLRGSPAIDAIPPGACMVKDPSTNQPILTDQRGVMRPQGKGCDIGAYEFS